MAQSDYYVIFLINQDSGMRIRIAACAEEQAQIADKSLGMDPEEWAIKHRWDWATSPGWVAKVQSALANNVDNWGLDPTVISDGDVLAAIQPLVQAL
jgi:hypothetical protein